MELQKKKKKPTCKSSDKDDVRRSRLTHNLWADFVQAPTKASSGITNCTKSKGKKLTQWLNKNNHIKFVLFLNYLPIYMNYTHNTEASHDIAKERKDIPDFAWSQTFHISRNACNQQSLAINFCMQILVLKLKLIKLF